MVSLERCGECRDGFWSGEMSRFGRSGFRQKSDLKKDLELEEGNSGESHYDEPPLGPYVTQFPNVNEGLFYCRLRQKKP